MILTRGGKLNRRKFLFGLIATPLAAALAKVPLPQSPRYLDYNFLTDQTEDAGIQRKFAMGRQETPFSVDVNRIEVVERWTREGGIRRIGNGPWEQIWGSVPVPFVVPLEVSHWTTTRWISPREAIGHRTS